MGSLCGIFFAAVFKKRRKSVSIWEKISSGTNEIYSWYRWEEENFMPYLNTMKKGMSENYEYWNVSFNRYYVYSGYWINGIYCSFHVLLVSLENCKKNQTWYSIIWLIKTEYIGEVFHRRIDRIKNGCFTVYDFMDHSVKQPYLVC